MLYVILGVMQYLIYALMLAAAVGVIALCIAFPLPIIALCFVAFVINKIKTRV